MASIAGAECKHFGRYFAFDPAEGQTVIAPPAEGVGNWVGAPSVVYDSATSRFLLSYRVRKPRPVRGGECYIAESDDGVTYKAIWAATKEAFDSPSVERFCLTKALDGKWLLYPSYVDSTDNRWCIDVIEADGPSAFDVADRKPLLRAGDLGVEGVKDPWVMIVNGLYYMLVSYAVSVEVAPGDRERMHASSDIYNTGLTLSSTGLAVSGDGRTYEWLGDIFPPRPGRWDAYAARLGCLVPSGSGWVGFYDGAASVEGNYEERTGLVQTWDLRYFYRMSQDAPTLVSPHGSGSLRYVDVVVFEDALYIYYEMCRPDGSHELRMNRVEL